MKGGQRRPRLGHEGREQPSMVATGTQGGGKTAACKEGGYFLSWAAKKEARMVPEMLW